MPSSLLIAVPVLAYILIPLSKSGRYLVAAALVASFYWMFWPITHRNYQLDKEGRHTTGVLLSKDCSRAKHPSITYQFHVGGTAYTATGEPGSGNQSCTTFQIGDQVFITYLPNDPDVNVAEREVDSDFFLGILGHLLMFPALVWIKGEQSRFLKEKRK